jgi:uncharacterized protein
MGSPEFVHVSDRQRYEIRMDDAVIGRNYYREEDGRRIFTHTEVEPEFQGQGLASRLIEFALTDTKKAGLRIVALCPAVSGYLEKHREFDDLVDAPA